MDERIMYKRSRVLREYVTSLHLTTMFIGLGLCSLGAYLINSSMSRTVSILLLILGVLITITGSIGCFGAHIENTAFLNTFSSITAITFILELVTLGLVYSHESEVDYYGSFVWDFFQENDSKFLLDIEKSFKCCGYASIGDRPIPKTCNILLGVEIGCRESILTSIKNQHQWITIVIIILLSTQFISLLISVILSFIMDRETREEETYLSLLSRNNQQQQQQQYSWLNHHHNNSFHGSSFHGSEHSYPRSFINNRSSQRSIPKYGSTPSY